MSSETSIPDKQVTNDSTGELSDVTSIGDNKFEPQIEVSDSTSEVPSEFLQEDDELDL